MWRGRWRRCGLFFQHLLHDLVVQAYEIVIGAVFADQWGGILDRIDLIDRRDGRRLKMIDEDGLGRAGVL